MNFQLKQSERKKAKIKMALKGCSSSGKSMSALFLAKGLCNGDMSKVGVIDTENSIELYSHVGNFNVLSLSPPFSPERYIQAIETCEKAGMKVIIIDSISHCWHYLLQLHGTMPGNSFINWNRITPLHNLFIQKIQQSPCHIISTMRTKQDYIIQTKEGKTSIDKIGLKTIQRNEIEYEFTLVFDLNINHQAKAVKDRTGLFMNKPTFVINEDTGQKILKWCNQEIRINDIKDEITKTNSIKELTSIYNKYPVESNLLQSDYTK